MLDPNALAALSLNSFSTLEEDSELSRRLGLYQVFLRLYEQNRGLLDEILSLEVSGARSFVGSMFPHVQGVVLDQKAYLITNLIGSKTQALIQPQRIWTIGRDYRQVVIPIRDRRLSRCHAAIEYIDHEGFYLTDLGSSNGSFVNGEMVRHHFHLKDGDQVRLGSFTFSFFVCDTRRTLGVLSAEMLSKISISDMPPTVPLDPPLPETPSQGSESEPTSASVLDETSTFMRDRLHHN